MDPGRSGVIYVMDEHASAVPLPALSDRAAFTAAISPHYDHLVRRLMLILRDTEEARDVAQSAVMRAFEHRHRFDGQDVRAWLFTIGIRLALNEVRRRSRLRRSLRRTETQAV
jgi:DNA-directed RNA polymerase specialized sigma24 family protein